MQPLSEATAALFLPLQIPDCDFCDLELTGDNLDFFSASFYEKEARYGQTYKGMPSRETQKLITRFPEKSRLHDKSGPFLWKLPATDYVVELLAALWPRESLGFAGEDTKTVFDFILQRGALADVCAENAARFKAGREVPAHEWEFAGDNPLVDYQQIGLCNVRLSSGYGLGMEQGTGKTPIGVADICNEAKELAERIAAGLEPQRMLLAIVVAPNNVRANWESEFRKFATRPGKTTVLRGTNEGRFKQLIEAFTPEEGLEYTVVICGYDTLTAAWNALCKVEWDIAILDESHFIKNPKTQRFAVAMKLRDKAKRRRCMSGTPITNSALDLYAQFEFLGKGLSGFNSPGAFNKFYGKYEISESGHRALIGIQNKPFMQERLARYWYLIRKEEALPDLPAKVYDIIEVELSAEQIEYYQQLSSKLALEIESDLSNDSLPRSMIINNVLTKLLRLAQITSGFVQWSAIHNDEGEVTQPAHYEYFYPNPKIDEAMELLSNLQADEKALVWAVWIPDILYLQSACEQNGIDCVTFTGKSKFDERVEAERRFNFEPNCKAFIGTPQSGGVGLNLIGYPPGKPELAETDTTLEIFYSQNWSSTARSQSEDRAHRRGTRRPVRIVDLVAPDTIDSEIRERVLGKQISALEISDLREILANCLKPKDERFKK